MVGLVIGSSLSYIGEAELGDTDDSSSAVGTSTGTSTVSGVGAATAESVGSSTGMSSVTGAGASTAEAVASSSGSSTVSGVGVAVIQGAGSSAGTSTVSATGAAVAESVGSSTGTSTVDGVGSSTASGEGVGTSSGSSTVSGVGAAEAAAVGTSDGTSTVSGVGDSTTEDTETGAYLWDDKRARRLTRARARAHELAEQYNRAILEAEESERQQLAEAVQPFVEQQPDRDSDEQQPLPKADVIDFEAMARKAKDRRMFLEAVQRIALARQEDEEFAIMVAAVAAAA